MNQEQLQDLHKLVWDFRGMASEFWPTPEPDDALRYAFTEAGEAIDADLRAKRPSDKRNNDKNHDRLDEWADCAIMLLTALPEWAAVDWYPAHLSAPTDEMICLRVVNHMANPSGVGNVQWTIVAISQIPGIDLHRRIVRRLLRITYKHVPAYRHRMIVDYFAKRSSSHVEV